MEKLEILGMLFILNASRIKSQLFLRNSSLKGWYFSYFIEIMVTGIF